MATSAECPRTARLPLAAAVDTDVVKALRLEPGVVSVDTAGAATLVIAYHPDVTGLDLLLPWLSARGLKPDGGPIARLALMLRVFRDANGRELLADQGGWEDSLRRLHVSRQPLRQHGRRDERAQHWRKYLDRQA